MKRLSTLVFVASMFFVVSGANAYDDRTITLASGNLVKVRIIGPLVDSAGDQSFDITHVVDGRINETDALKLADAIWAVLQSDIEKRKVPYVLLFIQEAPQPPASAVYTFRYEKFPDAKWKMTWHH